MHGIKTNILTTGTRPIAALTTATIGLICTATAAEGAATDALDTAFPLDTPVLVTDIRRALADAGTGGTLKPALEAIADQASPILIVVRVDVDELTQDDLVVGDLGTYTGMQALLSAEAQTGRRPRIIGAPGLDTRAAPLPFMAYAARA